jgi:hypothetical protein
LRAEATQEADAELLSEGARLGCAEGRVRRFRDEILRAAAENEVEVLIGLLTDELGGGHRAVDVPLERETRCGDVSRPGDADEVGDRRRLCPHEAWPVLQRLDRPALDAARCRRVNLSRMRGRRDASSEDSKSERGNNERDAAARSQCFSQAIPSLSASSRLL